MINNKTIAVIAEKPSVAREIALILGANKLQEGYREGNGYRVTWAFGHLVELAMPDFYGFKSFDRDSLPLMPESFQLVPRQVKTEKGYKADAGVQKQLNIIRKVVASSDEIIVATDAGREGELIFRYIYSYLKLDKPFSRLWINSLTIKAIQEGFANLKPGKAYDSLYEAAKSRSEADWLVGINASQALSVVARHGIYSLGRVQTPTLAMICSRYLDNKQFIPQKYWQLSLGLEKDGIAFRATSDKYEQKEEAEKHYEQLKGLQEVTVTNIDQKEVSEEAPLLYDLTSLQKDANSKLGYSAEKTLSLAQNLYERKLITYPRTGSQYIPEDVFETIPDQIKRFRNHPIFGGYALPLMDQKLNTRSVNNAKITDHHAILTTENYSIELGVDEKKVYHLIILRILQVFSPKCVKDVSTINLLCKNISFTAKGSVIKQEGWRKVGKEEEQEITILPQLHADEILTSSACVLTEKQTKPKPIHTEASLLSAMEQAGKELEDEEQREAMKDSGIGTPATRASIIETLLTREYVVRNKRSLIPTEKGLAVYSIVKSMRIANVEMTGMWEKALSEIEKEKMDAATFRKSIEVYTKQITTELLTTQLGISAAPQPDLLCPKCREGKMQFYNKVVKCNNQSCSLPVFKEIAQKILSTEDMANLIQTGKTKPIKGFKSKQGKSFEASLAFDEDYKVVFVFKDKKR